MYSAVKILNILLPFLYCLTFLVYLYDFVKEKNRFANSKRIFLFVTLLTHAIYLLVRTVEFNHPPITNVFEIFTVLAFAISCSYFILELLTDIRGTGLFIIIFSIIFQLISSIFIQDLLQVREVLRNRMLGLHVISALLGYSGITISAVYGILFWILYKEIKLNRFGLIFDRLPSLDVLEQLSFYSVVIGFVLFSVAITIGVVWLPSAFPNFNYFDPKLTVTAVIWLIYGLGILSKIVGRWHGKKVIVFSIAGFCLAIFSMLLTNFLAKSFHSFY
ncbi:MAG: cytochrome c biogenesis protein CcsA [Bacteroidota bacterium]|nr:cytochrome c biogenesis protein CcsA [Bacteroidota bacterium]MDP4190105.1 cytochrome c biogenesis protein CcsA [Bacteroidota bacterium]MDP4193720.1 cytochrome c biogenesis protein CcsA [Bacteroidota bacterium]